MNASRPPFTRSEDTLVEVVILGVVGLAALAVTPLWLAAHLAGLLAGRPVHLGLTKTFTALLHLCTHLADPARAFPPVARRDLPGPVVFYTCLLLTLAGLLAAGMAALHLARRLAGAHRGYASAHQVAAHLSLAAARRRARVARPALTDRRPPGRQVGLYLGRDSRSRHELYGSTEDSYLYLGPPRSGKGVHLIIPQTLDAPGAVLVTATRPDTLHHTWRLRAQTGPVAVFDPQQLAERVPRLRWSPLAGCTDPLVAISRARALAAGAQLTSGSVTDGDFWRAMTEAVLRCYLHAAALTARPVIDLLAWTARPADPTPLRILRANPDAAGGWADELAAQAGADPRQRDSVWAGVRRAVDALADPRVAEACSPPGDAGFEPARFLDECGSLYLLGTTGVQLSVAPLITALVEHLLDVARTRAAHAQGGRLDPPLTLLLDEAANIAPLPSLPNLLADGGGSGITTVAVLQSLAQARARWGEPGADALWDAATTKVILGGLAHADDLARISRLAGDIDEPTRTRATGPGGPSTSISDRRVPALPVETLRCLPPGQAIVLARHTPPVRARLTPWWRRRDAEEIRAGVKAAAA
ncbi:MAG: type IV secretory system conjugative DNA transfer family protein [Mycobacteriales bacterium]